MDVLWSIERASVTENTIRGGRERGKIKCLHVVNGGYFVVKQWESESIWLDWTALMMLL